MKRILLGLAAVAVILLATTPALAHGRYPYGYRVGFYAGYAPSYWPYYGGYYFPHRVYYPVAPVYPAYPPYPPYPPYPYVGAGYHSPGFSFSFGH
jgi:hypothetical protein